MMGVPFSIEMIISNHNIGVNPGDAETLVGLGPDEFARREHKHSTGDITTGTMHADRLPKANTTNKGIISLSNLTNSDSEEMAATSKAVKTVMDSIAKKADVKHSHSASDITAGKFPGIVEANSNTSYATKQVRNIIVSKTAPTAAIGANGDIYFQYDA